MTQSTFEVRHKYEDTILYRGEAENFKKFIERLVRDKKSLCNIKIEGEDLSGINLSGAKLRGSYLYRVNLSNADLTGADLTDVGIHNSNLTGVDLYCADLIAAVLASVDLTGACLAGASFVGAYIQDVILTGAKLNWSSHQLMSILLLKEAGCDIEKRAIAGIVAVSTDWCWRDFLEVDYPGKDWALGVLRGYIVEGDTHPEELDEEIANV